MIFLTKEKTDSSKVISDYLNQKEKGQREELKWIVILQFDKITYYLKNRKLGSVSFGGFNSREKKRDCEILASLLSLGSKYTTYNAENFAFQFGQFSLLFFYALDCLKQSFIQRQDTFKKSFDNWRERFEKIYRKKDTTLELFLKHTYLALLIQLVSVHYFSEQELRSNSIRALIEQLKEENIILFPENYFTWALDDINLVEELFSGLKILNHTEYSFRAFEPEDIFHRIYPQMISSTTRQALGEFYTPPELAKVMIREFYEFGKRIFDPACGSGTFLVEIINRILTTQNTGLEEQLKALKKINAVDVNPIAVATAKANMILRLKKLGEKRLRVLDQNLHKKPLIKTLTANIFLCNVLFPEKCKEYLESHKMDLIIGNPPWLVLNGIHNSQYKERVKNLAREMEIVPAPHQLSQLEISALFLYRGKHYLNDGGRIFFIVSNGFMTGNNHTGTRRFNEFDDIHIWKFTKDIFNIHSICISLKYVQGLRRSLSDLRKLDVLVTSFEPSCSNSKITFTQIKEEWYQPYDVESKSLHQSLFVKKIIPKKLINTLLPLGMNAYKADFYNGATLYPRNLIFVKSCKDPSSDGKYCEIRPVIRNPKKPWDFNPLLKMGLQSIKVEKNFVFPALKSTEIVPFAVLRISEVFLPIETDEETGGYKLTQNSKTLGWQYFEKLNQLYRTEQKKGATIQDLWQNLNYQGKLATARQRSPIRVVMMGRGTLVKACILRKNDVIVDNANYFISLKDEDEAHYLSAFLNSPSLTNTVQVIQDEGAGGKGRNIHKHPLEIQLPKFNSENRLHQTIVKKAKEMEEKTQEIIGNWIGQERNKRMKNVEREQTTMIEEKIKRSDYVILKPRTIQNRLYKQLGWDTRRNILKGDYAELDQLLQQLLKVPSLYH
ncbi:MAG: class I SAM-dependent DNA methyltransferase [Candidatus Hodarchaeota archaeon]